MRKQQGLSQAQLAEKLDISPKMVDYYERRATNPSIAIVKKAAELFGVGVADILGERSAAPAKKKPGPPSALEERIAKVRELPKKEQEFVIRMLDTVLEGARR
ncbi:MAG: helix-turn-helix domain-containing protein [Deltaproteobacteria bacterium]|nr:helix-turn-helix domain-containing protein [Deltaproteobacteria bacterium]